MTRGDGFQTADIDVGLLRDVKLRRLRRSLSAAAANAATMLYLSVVLSSWEEGDRLTVEEADSPISATPALCAALREAGLVDDELRIPEATWASWFGPAWDRREKKRTAGRAGNDARWHSDPRAIAERSHSDPDASPDGAFRDSPYRTGTDPKVPTTGDGAPRARPLGDGPQHPKQGSNAVDGWFNDGKGSPFAVAWGARGLKRPPTERQRAALWPAVDAQPFAVAEWVREAPPGAKAAEVVGHVLDRWRAVREAVPPDRPPRRPARGRSEPELAAEVAARALHGGTT